MRLIRFLIREAAILIAFVVLGALLLVSSWFSTNVNQGLLSEFKNDQVSVILNPGEEAGFRDFSETYPGMIRYEIHDGETNKAELGRLYPELSNVLQPLDSSFFPISATVTVQDGREFIKALEGQNALIEASLSHVAPKALRNFLNFSSLVFVGLWVLALLLLLYFQLERTAFQESQKWSLYKMLGAHTSKVFLPLWIKQSIRIIFASLLAVLFSYFVTEQIETLFGWNWSTKPLLNWMVFVLFSLGVSSLVLGFLFRVRYREVKLG